MKSIDDLASACIRCGFCLEACPTYRLTGEESESPRGRIYLIRNADAGRISWLDTRPHLDRCLGCRACEPACPSGVQYGALLEMARERLGTPPGERMGLAALTRPALLKTAVALGELISTDKMPSSVSLLFSEEPPTAAVPKVQAPAEWPPLLERDLPPIRGEVHLLLGCAMRVLFPRVHEATRRLLRRVGFRVTASDPGCCGALHAHAGALGDAHERVARVGTEFDGGLPIVVNSAGCGSWLKEQPEFADRVCDLSEFLLREGLVEGLAAGPGLPITATYHDACHLAHGQGIRAEPRELLAAIPGATWVPLADSDTCCGSAGIYNLTQPTLARRLLDRKWKAVEATGSRIVVLGNPGCHAWLAQAARERGDRITVVHTAEMLEASFSGWFE